MPHRACLDTAAAVSVTLFKFIRSVTYCPQEIQRHYSSLLKKRLHRWNKKRDCRTTSTAMTVQCKVAICFQLCFKNQHITQVEKSTHVILTQITRQEQLTWIPPNSESFKICSLTTTEVFTKVCMKTTSSVCVSASPCKRMMQPRESKKPEQQWAVSFLTPAHVPWNRIRVVCITVYNAVFTKITWDQLIWSNTRDEVLKTLLMYVCEVHSTVNIKYPTVWQLMQDTVNTDVNIDDDHIWSWVVQAGGLLQLSKARKVHGEQSPYCELWGWAAVNS